MSNRNTLRSVMQLRDGDGLAIETFLCFVLQAAVTAHVRTVRLAPSTEHRNKHSAGYHSSQTCDGTESHRISAHRKSQTSGSEMPLLALAHDGHKLTQVRNGGRLTTREALIVSSSFGSPLHRSDSSTEAAVLHSGASPTVFCSQVPKHRHRSHRAACFSFAAGTTSLNVSCRPLSGFQAKDT